MAKRRCMVIGHVHRAGRPPDAQALVCMQFPTTALHYAATTVGSTETTNCESQRRFGVSRRPSVGLTTRAFGLRRSKSRARLSDSQ
mgnify:CR=1 FL=1